mgnify:CR=1 FL=1
MFKKPHSPDPAAPSTPVRPSGSATAHLHQEHLARRWGISPRTLERWRVEGRGPRYMKIGGRVLYRLEDIEAYETSQAFNNTAEFAAARGGLHGR